MKRRVWVWAALCAGMLATFTAARAEEPESAQPSRRERPGRRPPRDRGRDAMRAAMRFSGQFRDAVMSEIELTEEQKANLNQAFQEHGEAMQEVMRGPREGEQEEGSEERIAELERQAEAAREAGDREEVRRLRMEAAELRRGGAQHAPELQRLNDELVEKVKTEVGEEQAGKIDSIVRRIRVQNEGGDPAMRLMQTSRRAAARMDLDPEQRRKVNEALRNVMRETATRGPDQPQEPEALMEQLQHAVTEALGAELGEQFMQALEEEQRAAAAREAPAPAPEEGHEPQEKDQD